MAEDPSLTYAPGHNDHYFRRLFLSVTEHAIVLLDRMGRITGWSPGAERLFGWSAEEALGQSSALIFTEEDRRAGAPETELERAAARGRADDTRWHVRKDGGRFWAIAAAETVYGDNGRVEGFVKIVRDRTDIKRYEEQLERSNRDLDAFASHLAHEVRSPLTGVRMALGALLRRYADTLQAGDQELVEEAIDAIDDIDTLTSDLLAYARLSRSPQFDREHIESQTVLQDALALLDEEIDVQQAEVTAGALPAVQANPAMLRTLFRNLVGNALKYNEADVPRVRVAAEDADDAWVFSVEDNGIGIPEERRENIFDLFERGETGETVGVGVGLALARRIVERHGGRIWVESEPDRGSTFYFTLPKAPPSGG